MIINFIGGQAQAAEIRAAGQPAELAVSEISEYTIRITLRSVGPDGKIEPLGNDLILEPESWPQPVFRARSIENERSLALKNLYLKIRPSPLVIVIKTKEGKIVQTLAINEQTGVLAFTAGKSPLLGLGGGGPQFDKRGTYDAMNNGHRAGEYQIYGSRM